MGGRPVRVARPSCVVPGTPVANVYVLGLEEGKLPNDRAESDEAIREERRICFVGVCRAGAACTLGENGEKKHPGLVFAQRKTPDLRGF